MAKEIFVAFGVDVDAVAGWLGSYGGEDSPCDIHEIGMHGYSHENPIAMTPEQEEAVMDKCIELIERLCGRRPTGYVAPWWEFSPVTNELLLKKVIKYDHSLMNNDFHPFYVRVGDSWTKIDYSPASARRLDETVGAR